MGAEVVGGAPGAADAITAESPAGGSHPREVETPVDTRAGASPADESPDDDEDLLAAEDDFSDVPFHKHPRFQSVTKRLSKALRQVSRLRPLAERAKGVDLDALRSRAKVADEIEASLARHPELKSQLLNALSGTAPAAPAPAREPEFDPASLPFDVNDDVGKYFVAQHKTIGALQKQIEQLTGTITTTQQREHLTQRQRYESGWRSATDVRTSAPRGKQQRFRKSIDRYHRPIDSAPRFWCDRDCLYRIRLTDSLRSDH